MNGSEDDMPSRELCDLTQSYSFVLQSILGVLAFSTLILKRLCKPAMERRPFWIWLADTAKQALGMLEIHFVNLFLSALIADQECIVYLVSFLLDSTAGLFIIFLLLKAVAWLVAMFDLSPLRSGVYGSPFKFHYWLAQTAVYLAVMLLEKLIVGPLVAFPFWSKVERVILPWNNEQLKIAIVIFIVPFIVNVVMFWIVDSLLMWKKQLLGDKPSVRVHYHRHHSNSPYPHSNTPARSLRGHVQQYHQLCSSDSDSAPHKVPNNNPLYVESDLSESGEIRMPQTSVPT